MQLSLKPWNLLSYWPCSRNWIEHLWLYYRRLGQTHVCYYHMPPPGGSYLNGCYNINELQRQWCDNIQYCRLPSRQQSHSVLRIQVDTWQLQPHPLGGLELNISIPSWLPDRTSMNGLVHYQAQKRLWPPLLLYSPPLQSQSLLQADVILGCLQALVQSHFCVTSRRLLANFWKRKFSLPPFLMTLHLDKGLMANILFLCLGKQILRTNFICINQFETWIYQHIISKDQFLRNQGRRRDGKDSKVLVAVASEHKA